MLGTNWGWGQLGGGAVRHWPAGPSPDQGVRDQLGARLAGGADQARIRGLTVTVCVIANSHSGHSAGPVKIIYIYE